MLGCLLFPVPLLLVPLAAAAEPRTLVLNLLITAVCISGFGLMVLDVSIGSISTAVIPDPLRSRVAGAFQAVDFGTRPLGALLGGALGTALGVRPHPLDRGSRRRPGLPLAPAVPGPAIPPARGQGHIASSRRNPDSVARDFPETPRRAKIAPWSIGWIGQTSARGFGRRAWPLDCPKSSWLTSSGSSEP